MIKSQAGARATDREKYRIGVITAFPPGRNSLNEFGFHLVGHLADNDDVRSVVVFADETAAGPPLTADRQGH